MTANRATRKSRSHVDGANRLHHEKTLLRGGFERPGGEDKKEESPWFLKDFLGLLRLKLIIQERSDYLPAIQYISWIIRIKLQFKRQLLTKRSSIRKEQISLRAEATSVKNDIRTETGKLELLAETVRYYWAKPIASVSVRKTTIFCFPHMRRTAWGSHIKLKQPEKWLRIRSYGMPAKISHRPGDLTLRWISNHRCH